MTYDCEKCHWDKQKAQHFKDCPCKCHDVVRVLSCTHDFLEEDFHGDVYCKKCGKYGPFCAPVKKEPEEICGKHGVYDECVKTMKEISEWGDKAFNETVSPEDIAKKIVSRFSNENYEKDRWLCGNPERLKEQIADAILAERSTAPKDFGREEVEALEELLTESVELIFNSAEQARKEGVPSCNFYDMERLISKTNLPCSKFRYVQAWKSYKAIKDALEALEKRRKV